MKDTKDYHSKMRNSRKRLRILVRKNVKEDKEGKKKTVTFIRQYSFDL